MYICRQFATNKLAAFFALSTEDYNEDKIYKSS